MILERNVLDPNPSGNPPILLLHGLGATSISWTQQLSALMNVGFRPLAPDLPGFGSSPYDGKGWTLKGVTHQLAELIEGYLTGPVHVIGLSMGGVIAQHFAHEYPHRTGRLILTSTFAALRPDSISGYFYFFRRFFSTYLRGLSSQAKIVADRVFPGIDQGPLRDMLISTILNSDHQVYKAAMRELIFFDSRRWIGSINKPILVVSGSNDTTVSPTLQAYLTRLIPGAKQVIVEAAGHAVNVDRAEDYNRIIIEFLK